MFKVRDNSAPKLIFGAFRGARKRSRVEVLDRNCAPFLAKPMAAVSFPAM